MCLWTCGFICACLCTCGVCAHVRLCTCVCDEICSNCFVCIHHFLGNLQLIKFWRINFVCFVHNADDLQFWRLLVNYDNCMLIENNFIIIYFNFVWLIIRCDSSSLSNCLRSVYGLLEANCNTAQTAWDASFNIIMWRNEYTKGVRKFIGLIYVHFMLH